MIVFSSAVTRMDRHGAIRYNSMNVGPKQLDPEEKPSTIPPPGEPRHPEQLARLAARGEPAATAQLLRLLAPEMMRVVRGVMGPYTSDAEDALQQALVALVHALPAFRGECSPAGYACRIAFRSAMRVRRGAHRARARRDDLAQLDGMVSGDSADAPASTRRRTDMLRRLLDELPAEQAEALALRTMLGWSLEEIASASNAPINTVRSRLRLAKEALRGKIEADPKLCEELGAGRAR